MASPFYGARLKIERAKEHINDLNSRAQLFADTHPHTINLETDLDTGDKLLSIAPAEPFPDQLVCILGDALHNLRSALDHAWCSMVVSQTKWTRFPLRDTKQSFESAIVPSRLWKRGPAKRLGDFSWIWYNPMPEGSVRFFSTSTTSTSKTNIGS